MPQRPRTDPGRHAHRSEPEEELVTVIESSGSYLRLLDESISGTVLMNGMIGLYRVSR